MFENVPTDRNVEAGITDCVGVTWFVHTKGRHSAVRVTLIRGDMIVADPVPFLVVSCIPSHIHPAKNPKWESTGKHTAGL